MRFSTLFLAGLGAISASALPTTDTCSGSNPNKYFGLIAIHSGNAVHNAALSASLSSIFANLPNQNAQCNRPNERFATFYIKDGALFLYTPESAEKQQMFVDRSGMGMGKIGYITGSSGHPRYAELTGWSINSENHLQFAGNDLVACPNSIQNSWSIWAAGFQNPGHNQNCIGIAARVEYSTDPNACVYS
ncbi:hypothetical protein LOZ57_000713 [Ophidiomyces ophidiicola]|uniref:uncharacterized protein n=1 Tax=Ophidiomyces ophidiicola TaxID=1387563 RepID=UPI0020C33B10|nr:uncharacterized protein LOZ57_000713 [Ophidiomyces ophidiicola]KAI1952634.1 hypothetical protein LOZ57_000713 [Ophidiomyces ophidiicola]KAI2061477.1 hypothetical protein LOZ43_001092 [Ophidiomyces ophidiicola]KAI2090728.1 hypothetical protein LOZ36_001209 [Ophidiomyces ophidiicola]